MKTTVKRPSNKRPGHPKFYKLLELMADTYAKKNEDYSGGNPLGNFLECRRAGIDEIDGLLTRIGDKFARVYSLNVKRKKGKGPAVTNEKLEDTLLDLSVYSLIGIILLAEKKHI